MHRNKRRGLTALDGILIFLIILALIGFINSYILSGELSIGKLVGENREEEKSLESIGPKLPIKDFSWKSGVITKNAKLSFNIELDSEESVKIEVYRIENSEMISLYEDWKYPSKNYPYKVSTSVSISKSGETLGTEKYALVVRNTDNKKVLQKVREWEKGEVDFTIESASPDGKINMKLTWKGGNSKEKLYLPIGDVECYIGGKKKKITKSEFKISTLGDWEELSKEHMTVLGPSWQYKERYVKISLDSKVGEGLQHTKIVFRDAYGNKATVYDENIAYV